MEKPWFAMVLNGTAASAYDIHEIASQSGRLILPPYPQPTSFQIMSEEWLGVRLI